MPLSAIIVPLSACDTSLYPPVNVTRYWRLRSPVASQTSPLRMKAIEPAFAAESLTGGAAAVAVAASAATEAAAAPRAARDGSSFRVILCSSASAREARASGGRRMRAGSRGP
jgi:hypothetical protein